MRYQKNQWLRKTEAGEGRKREKSGKYKLRLSKTSGIFATQNKTQVKSPQLANSPLWVTLSLSQLKLRGKKSDQ